HYFVFFDLHSFPTRRSSDLYSTLVVANKSFGGTKWRHLAEIGLVVVRRKFYCRAITTPRLPRTLFSVASPDWLVSPAALNQARLDRKSTRLNSSHLGISYAV